MITICVLTISDSGARGTRPDTSGETICSMVTRLTDAVVSAGTIIPDERLLIEATLREWCDDKRLNLVLTTGGTGLGPRDVTPEATRAIIEREAPGIAEAMRAESLRHTPFGMLSRGVAGTRGRTLIINLPGSPGGVRDGLAVLADVLDHALDQLGGKDHPR